MVDEDKIWADDQSFIFNVIKRLSEIKISFFHYKGDYYGSATGDPCLAMDQYRSPAQAFLNCIISFIKITTHVTLFIILHIFISMMDYHITVVNIWIVVTSKYCSHIIVP